MSSSPSSAKNLDQPAFLVTTKSFCVKHKKSHSYTFTFPRNTSPFHVVWTVQNAVLNVTINPIRSFPKASPTIFCLLRVCWTWLGTRSMFLKKLNKVVERWKIVNVRWYVCHHWKWDVCSDTAMFFLHTSTQIPFGVFIVAANNRRRTATCPKQSATWSWCRNRGATKVGGKQKEIQTAFLVFGFVLFSDWGFSKAAYEHWHWIIRQSCSCSEGHNTIAERKILFKSRCLLSFVFVVWEKRCATGETVTETEHVFNNRRQNSPIKAKWQTWYRKANMDTSATEWAQRFVRCANSSQEITSKCPSVLKRSEKSSIVFALSPFCFSHISPVTPPSSPGEGLEF